MPATEASASRPRTQVVLDKRRFETGVCSTPVSLLPGPGSFPLTVTRIDTHNGDLIGWSDIVSEREV